MEARAGFLTSDEVVERYAQQSGRSVDALDWYVVFASFKLSIIVEGIHARFRMGKTLGEGFDAMGQTVVALVDGALEEANQSSIPALRG
jgi:aminoglycoside phosphotransferase (APT) family kinase protein